MASRRLSMASCQDQTTRLRVLLKDRPEAMRNAQALKYVEQTVPNVQALKYVEQTVPWYVRGSHLWQQFERATD